MVIKVMRIISASVVAVCVYFATFEAIGETADENYRLYCVQCHGTLGNGLGINETYGGLNVSPKDHTLAKEMEKLSDEDLRLAIAEGGEAVQKSSLMPAWANTLSSMEISDLIVYLRNLCRCKAISR
jgi:mono/diheme cytochrome c family protein